MTLHTLQVIGEGEFARGVCCVSFSKMVGLQIYCAVGINFVYFPVFL